MSAEHVTAAPLPSAARLAARIQIPRRLPPRYLSVVGAVNGLRLLGFVVLDMSLMPCS